MNRRRYPMRVVLDDQWRIWSRMFNTSGEIR